MDITKVADRVWLIEKEGAWSYVTRWGNIDNAWAFVKAHCRYFINHRLEDDDIEGAGFAGLYEAMTQFYGQRSIEAYASYHIFRALRKYVETFGYMRLGEPYLILHSPHFAVVHHYPREITEAETDRPMDRYPAPEASIDTSQFWECAGRIALTCGTKPERDWDILKQLCTGERSVCLGAELNLHRCSVNKVRRTLGRRMGEKWSLKEAVACLRGNGHE